MNLLFISNIVPDREEYWNEAFTRAGNNVFLGMSDAFPKNTFKVEQSTVVDARRIGIGTCNSCGLDTLSPRLSSVTAFLRQHLLEVDCHHHCFY